MGGAAVASQVCLQILLSGKHVLRYEIMEKLLLVLCDLGWMGEDQVAYSSMGFVIYGSIEKGVDFKIGPFYCLIAVVANTKGEGDTPLESVKEVGAYPQTFQLVIYL